MHPVLADSLDRICHRLEEDERCAALLLTGSLGSGTADEFSDVDAVAVVRDAEYDSFSRDLRPMVEHLCGPVVGWLPEPQTASVVVYAFLFWSGDDLLLFDLYVVRERAASGLVATPIRVLFDRDGMFADSRSSQRTAPLTAEEIGQVVEQWWVYAYLNGKYLQRGDIFKLLYVQGVLLQAHVKVLNGAHCPDHPWSWWARDLKELPAQTGNRLLVYFGATDADGIRAALRQEMDFFSQDARAACRRLDAAYHHELESAVRAHLSGMGV